MPLISLQPLAFTPPTPEEARALKVAGDYLVRAGAEAARRLFDNSGNDANVLATVSDSLLAGAILCAELMGSPDNQRQL